MTDFHRENLLIDCADVAAKIISFIKNTYAVLKRDGMIVGLSGGIDSSLTAQLCVQTLGKDRVLGLILPEKESNPISAEYALAWAERLGIKTETVDITSTLESFGVYDKRDQAIRNLLPDYDQQYKAKIVLPAKLLERDSFNFYTLTIDDGKGHVKSTRLDNRNFREIVAATNAKQRTRMMYLYYYAEANNLAVCGTTNKSETIQGFFVKYGDGGVDLEPIAQLYKSQVYQLANYYSVMEEIIKREPSPDTFSLEVSDEDFYFRMPYDTLDLLLYAWENNCDIAQVGKVMNLTTEQVKRAFRDFTAKYNATNHLRNLPFAPEK